MERDSEPRAPSETRDERTPKNVTTVNVVLGLGDDERAYEAQYAYTGPEDDPTWLCDYCLHPSGGDPVRLTPAVDARWDNMADCPTLVCDEHNNADNPLVADVVLEQEDGLPWRKLLAVKAMLKGETVEGQL